MLNIARSCKIGRSCNSISAAYEFNYQVITHIILATTRVSVPDAPHVSLFWWLCMMSDGHYEINIIEYNTE